jgi:hypothetical protein
MYCSVCKKDKIPDCFQPHQRQKREGLKRTCSKCKREKKGARRSVQQRGETWRRTAAALFL